MAGAEQLDPALVSARRKRQSGERLTQREEIAWRRHERKLREQIGPGYVRALPKKDALAAAGVSNKSLLEWADRFDAPWRPHDKTVDGFALLRWACGLIAECSTAIGKHLKAKRNQAAVEEFLPDLAPLDWQDECFKERAWELADRRLLRRKEMLHAAMVGEIHQRIAGRLQSLGDGLGKRYGEEAQRLFQQTWDDIAADVMRLIDSGDGDDDGGDDPARAGDPDR